MVEAGEKAMEKIKQFLKEQEMPKPIRVLMTEGGWRGPYLVMALDDQKETDKVFTQDDVTFVIDKALLDKAKHVKIDYVESALGPGYVLKSDLLKGIVGECEDHVCQTCYPHG
jgi:HesB-like selenoprotein